MYSISTYGFNPDFGEACQRSSHWFVPLENLSKISVDAALTRNCSVGAFAAVCRNYQRAFTEASAIVVAKISDPTMLEALAVREALALVGDLYI